MKHRSVLLVCQIYDFVNKVFPLLTSTLKDHVKRLIESAYCRSDKAEARQGSRLVQVRYGLENSSTMVKHCGGDGAGARGRLGIKCV